MNTDPENHLLREVAGSKDSDGLTATEVQLLREETGADREAGWVSMMSRLAKDLGVPLTGEILWHEVVGKMQYAISKLKFERNAGYKSVALLATENPNLSAYLEKLEGEIARLNHLTRLTTEASRDMKKEGKVTTPKDDGGPAFPMQATFSPECGTMPGQEGMTLRDWFAGQALVGLLSCDGDFDTRQEYATRSYEFADCMIAERQKWNKP